MGCLKAWGGRLFELASQAIGSCSPRSNRLVGRAAIRQAKADKALRNPVFAPYRKVLELAEMIIELQSACESSTGAMRAPGFLINVAELFEIYVGKLLARHFLLGT